MSQTPPDPKLRLTAFEAAKTRLVVCRLDPEAEAALLKDGQVRFGRTSNEQDEWAALLAGDLVVGVAISGNKFALYACRVVAKSLGEISPQTHPEEKPFIIHFELLGMTKRSDIPGNAGLFSGVFDRPSRGVFQVLWEGCSSSNGRESATPLPGTGVERFGYRIVIAQTEAEAEFVHQASVTHPFGFFAGLLTLIAYEDARPVAALVASLSKDSRADPHRACWRIFGEEYLFVRANAVFVKRIYSARSGHKRSAQKALLSRLLELAHNLPSRPLSFVEGISYDFHPVGVSLGFSVAPPSTPDDSFYYFKLVNLPPSYSEGHRYEESVRSGVHRIIAARAQRSYWLVRAPVEFLPLAIEKGAWALRHSIHNARRWSTVKPGHWIFLMTPDFHVRACACVVGTESRHLRGFEGFTLWIDFERPVMAGLEVNLSEFTTVRWLDSLPSGGLVALPQELGAFLHLKSNQQTKKGIMNVKPNPYLLHGTEFDVRHDQVFLVQAWDLRDKVGALIRDILRKEKLNVVYSGDRNGQVVFSDIWLMLNESAIVIVDFTGRRPNVYLEYGMALVLGKPIVAITQHPEDLPSDTPHLKYIVYQNVLGDTALQSALRGAITNTVQDIERARRVPS
jgi:hypothetical protein